MPPHERLLEPLDGADVEVVGRLVEEDEVGIADHHPGQRGARLLAAAQRGWRLVPLSACEAQARERLVDTHVEVIAVARLEPLAELGVRGRRDGVGTGGLHLGQLTFHALDIDGARSDGEADRLRAHERRVEVRLLGEQADGQAATRHDLAGIGLIAPGGQAQERRLAGAVDPDQADPIALGDGPADVIEDDEGADLAADGRQSQDGHRSGAGSQQARRRRVAFRARQPLTPGAEVRATGTEHDAPDRAPAAMAGLPGPLIDVEVLLHLAVALGCRVVVDRAAPSIDGLLEDAAERKVEPALVATAQGRGMSQRVETRAPECLVGVDVADAGQEGLVEQERLEPRTPGTQALAEGRHGEVRCRAAPGHAGRGSS